MRRVGPFHVVPLLVLVLLLVVTAAATVLTGVVVRNQEHKLLAERANEVNLVLSHVRSALFRPTFRSSLVRWAGVVRPSLSRKPKRS